MRQVIILIEELPLPFSGKVRLGWVSLGYFKGRLGKER
jgi:hypothetical protein